MGTRYAMGFHVDGQDKVQYGQFDGYPDGVGKDTLKFIRDTNLKKIPEIAREIKLVSEEPGPTASEQEALKGWADTNVGSQSTSDWYVLLREAQGNWEAFTKGGLRYMLDARSFLFDSLFCEYAYIINIDTGKLEFYKGFNRTGTGRGRYARSLSPDSVKQMESAKRKAEVEHGPGGDAVVEVTHAISPDAYYGIVLVEEIDLHDLQRDLREKTTADIDKIVKRWDKLVEGEDDE